MDLRKKIFSDIKISKKQLILIASVFILFFLLFHNYPAIFYQSSRFNPSGFNSKFDFDTSKPFSDYISYSRNLIIQGRTDLEFGEVDGKTILEWNSPFALYPDGSKCGVVTKGALLIHGLTDSPFTLRELGEHLQKKCFVVYSILLSGDGTRPGDSLDMDYKDWIKQVEYGAKELNKQVSELYLVGYSTGGVLATNYAIDNNVDGLILFAPSFVLPKAIIFAPVVKYFYRWLNIYDDKDVIKYESFSTNSADQVRRIANLVESKLKKNNQKIKNTKIFALFSNEDKTIDYKGSVQMLLNHSDPQNRHIVIYHQGNSLVDAKLTREKNIYTFDASKLDEKIIGMSHLSLTLTPENSWAGKDGIYRVCLHYRKGSDKYQKCKKSPNVYFGEITKENLDNYEVVARSTYNPFIYEIYSKIDRFFGVY